MPPDDDILAKLQQKAHDHADLLHTHALQIALQARDVTSLALEFRRHRDGAVSHEELTGALGPIRGRLDLQDQALKTVSGVIADLETSAATKDGLAGALSLVRSDAANIQKDVSAIQDNLKWITRTLVAAMIVGVITLVVKVIQQ